MNYRFTEIFSYWDLLVNLTKKELKVKYRGTVMGFFWSLLNPLLTMLVFSFVFSFILRIGIEDFYIFFLCALLPWNLLSSSVNMSVGSIVANGGLIKKIYFPREIIPLSIVFSNLISFFLEMIVLFIFLIVAKYPFYRLLYFLPLLVIVQLFLVIGACFFFSSINVYFRDTQHLVNIFMMIWFYTTPIIYPLSMVPQRFLKFMVLNPMTPLIEFCRTIFYYSKHGELGFYNFFKTPGTYYFIISLSISLVVFFIGYFTFKKLEGKFAEEI